MLETFISHAYISVLNRTFYICMHIAHLSINHCLFINEQELLGKLYSIAQNVDMFCVIFQVFVMDFILSFRLC